MTQFRKRTSVIGLGVILLLSACSTEELPNEEGQATDPQLEENAAPGEEAAYKISADAETPIEHVHGLGFDGDTGELLFATHDGLRFFNDGAWYTTTSNRNDYMGFQATSEGFYASGHPGEGAQEGLVNPLGLVKSTDQGETIEPLSLFGQVDFHYMAASYEGKSVYGLITAEVEDESGNVMTPGIYRTSDEGNTWNSLALKGFSANSFGMMATHATDGEKLAIATQQGAYFSSDGGDTVSRITKDSEKITAIAFKGEQIIYAAVDGQDIVLRVINTDGSDVKELNNPYLDFENAITYITVNPENEEEIAFTTLDIDGYLSSDGGQSFQPILDEGQMQGA